MKPNTLLRRMAVLVATMMCALGANAQEAYACYTESNTTLTFYYDSQRSSREGDTFNLNEDPGSGSTMPDWKEAAFIGDVTQAVFDPSFAAARPTTTYGWFSGMENLQSITGMKEYLNTSEVINMCFMFENCRSLTSLDLRCFNTSKVTLTNKMFASCSSLTSLDLSSFNTANVTSMGQMFYGCENLQTIYVGDGWSTAAVEYSDNMFSGCINLVGGQGTIFDENHVDATYAHIDSPSDPGYFTEKWPEGYACYTPENTTLTFYYDNRRYSREGTTYDLNTGKNATGWDTDGTKSSVTKVVFDPSFAEARPTTTYRWFYQMTNLESIEGICYLNTSEVTNMFGMFAVCKKLTVLDLSGFNTAQVTDMGAMFWKCGSLKTIYVGNGWSTEAVTGSSKMFSDCNSLVGGQGTTYDASHIDATYAHVDEGTSNPGYFTVGNEAYACYTRSNTTLTFYYDNQRSSREGSESRTYDLNTVYNDPVWFVDGAYASATNVVFDSSFASVYPSTTYCWFMNMNNLKSITGMEYLNTSAVTNMAWMFTNCTSLTSLDLSHFNTAKVTNMVGMFSSCTSLTSLNLSSFNTSKVTEMFNMFNGCYSLNSLNLSSFNTSNVTNMGQMFYRCENLKTIYVGDGWSTDQVTKSDNMFAICYNLVGGQGTTWNDSNPKDATYAHIDESTSNPGYFSDISGLVTHIEAVPAKANTVKGIYTLDGRKLNELPTQKGIYIIDGRRVVIQ